MTSKHDPEMVKSVARAIMTQRYGHCDVANWREREWNPSVAATWDEATSALDDLDLPARDAAMLAQGRREGLEMAAGVCDVAGEMWSRAMAALKGDGMIRTVHVEAAQTLAAAIRAKIEEVKS